MYIVVARGNGVDSTFPSISPRYMTQDPKRALEEARRGFEKDSYFLTDVIIFKLNEDDSYSSMDSWGTEGSPAKTIVYVLWRSFRFSEGRSENFYHGFKELSGG